MQKYDRFFAFTLAEMLVVMLILTIMMAAFAPVMTKRKAVDLTSPWRYATNNNDAYFGMASSQTAMIGQNSKATNEKDSKLIINTSSANQSHILFKQSGNLKGHLRLTTDSLMLGAYNTSSSTSSSNNMTIGIDAFGSNSGMYNTVLGNQSLRYGSGSNYNTTVGYGAGYGGGSYNTLFGYRAGYDVGSNNTALGYGALDTTKTVSYNIAIGNNALKNLSGSGANVVIGNNSMTDSSGWRNIAIGANVLQGTSGDNNIGIGNDITTGLSGDNNILITSKSPLSIPIKGSNKTYIGSMGSYGLAQGGPFFSENDTPIIMLGSYDGKVIIPGDLLVMGNIWFHARPTNSTGSFEIGRLTWDGGENFGLKNVVVVANKKQCPSWYSDQICLPAYSWNDAKIWYDYSDKRLKNIRSESKAGIKEIRDIEVFDFTFKDDESKEPHVGVIAQDLQKVFPESVKKDDNGYLMIRKDEMFYAMLNSIKQLDKLVNGIINEIKIVLEKITGLDNRVQQLEKENKLLKEQINEMNKRLEKLEDD